MEALQITYNVKWCKISYQYNPINFHLHLLKDFRPEPETTYTDEDESEEPITANQIDEEGNDFERVIELHFKDGSTVEIVYNESIYRKLKQYFNA